MLNPFYWYSIIWSGIIVLYELKWSNYNTALEDSIFLFFVGSIIVSGILGYCFRNIFVYKPLNKLVKHNWYVTFILISLCFADFAYNGNIPLFAILSGKAVYGDFKVIPILHTFLVNFIIIYTGFLYYLFLETKKKVFLVETILVMSMFLLMYFKGSLIFCIFIIVNLYVAKKRMLWNIKKVLSTFLISGIVLSYFNGILSNLRHHNLWNDSSLITDIGSLSNSWPSFLPHQLFWSYSYLTSPLANLNLMTVYYGEKFDFFATAVNILPVFVTKRLFSELRVIESKTFILHNDSLTACTGYAEVLVAGGVIGMILLWIIFVLVILGLSLILERKEIAVRSVFYAVLSMEITFLFFYNTLTTAATSLLVFYILLYVFLMQRYE